MRYHGLSVLGGGATLAGIVLGSVTVMLIERKLATAALFALAGAVLTFFGLIHGEAIGFGSSPQVAAGYAVVAIILYACARKAFIMPVGAVAHEKPAL